MLYSQHISFYVDLHASNHISVRSLQNNSSSDQPTFVIGVVSGIITTMSRSNRTSGWFNEIPYANQQ